MHLFFQCTLPVILSTSLSLSIVWFCVHRSPSSSRIRPRAIFETETLTDGMTQFVTKTCHTEPFLVLIKKSRD
jgi:hypothetical protein